jgi:unsaturated rhamnogalacturonyl hydrolase
LSISADTDVARVRELLQRVFRYTAGMDLERDCWEKASALTAMIEQGDPEMLAVAERMLRRAVATQSSTGALNYNDTYFNLTDGHLNEARFVPVAISCALGYPLLRLYEHVGDKELLAAAGRQIDQLLTAPRSRDGGLSIRRESVELWIDIAHMIWPFLAKYGVLTGEDSLVDEAYLQMSVYCRHLVDPDTKLARHVWKETPNSYPQSTFWSRGNGWYGAGLVDLLGVAPDHPGAGEARTRLGELVEALVACQDRSGYWRHVLDDPDEWFESSGTLMLAYIIARAVQLGVADAAHLAAARRALAVVLDMVTPDGAVTGVSVPPGGPGVPLGVRAYGQGFFMLAAQAILGDAVRGAA